MAVVTITEGLAELKTLAKRIEKKQETVKQYLFRRDTMRDPLEKSGGSAKFVTQELQSINDLEIRIISIRRGIARANDRTIVNVCGEERTVSEWLTWRREIASKRQSFLSQLRQLADRARREAQRNQQTGQVEDVVVNINEKDLLSQEEKTEEILSTLDGKLSLVNATVTIDV